VGARGGQWGGQVAQPECGRIHAGASGGQVARPEVCRIHAGASRGQMGGKWGASRATGIWSNTSDRPLAKIRHGGKGGTSGGQMGGK